MMARRRKAGLSSWGELLRLGGTLAARYKDVLAEVTGRKTSLDQFHVDRRGVSPELAHELGVDYLTGEEGSQLVLIVSPDQATTLLLASESSWEAPLLDEVYDRAFELVADVTKHEVLLGEIDLGVAALRKPDDLLLIESVELSLDTLSSTVSETAELKRRAEQLGTGSNLLDDSYVERMLELSTKLGDVRHSPIEDIFPLSHELGSFYTDLFGGVTVLRGARPNRDKRLTLVILPPAQVGPDLGPSLEFLALDDIDLLDRLIEFRIATYDPDLAPRRIKEIEDGLLVSEGIDVTGLDRRSRQTELRRLESRLPDSWEELRSIEKIGRHGRPPGRAYMRKLSETTRIKLTRPRPPFEAAWRVLAELDESDPDRLLKYRPSRFLARLSEANDAERTRLEARMAGGRTRGRRR